MASIINTGVSALNAFKRQMETTGHNIANVNTEGFSRQTVQFDTRSPEIAPQGFIGSGVEVASIRRNYDDFLANRVRDYTSSHEEFSVYHARASQVDDVIADASAGINDTLQRFFASVNDVADDPTSIPARSVMLNQAEQLSDRFQSLNGWFENLRSQLNQDFERQVNEINGLADSLADTNLRIRNLAGAGGVPNDILDQRDRLVDELSKYTNVSTLQQSDGSMNVFIGTGQALVVGTNVNRLGVTNNPQAADQKELVIRQSGGSVVNVTAQMSGGTLGGLLRFRDEILDESQNALGRLAIGLGSFFNAEHRSGMDLDGQLGGDFFAVDTPQLVTGGSGQVSVALTDVAALTTAEYRLDFNGTNWSVTNLGSGATTALAGDGIVGSDGPFVIDGMSVSVNAFTAGTAESYRLRPTRDGAAAIRVLVGNARDIAAAEPVRSANAAPNAGTAAISGGALTSRTGDSPLAAPVTLSFDAALNRFDLSTGGSVAYDPGSDSGSTLAVSLAGLGDYSFTMSGTPADGDVFELSSNTGGVGDNRNARRLADLQTANLMIGGTASFGETYGDLIANVGTKTHQAGSNAGVQERLLSQAESAKSAVSGVNLDEEAANLVRFQQAYQAAAQVISIANSLFDSLLMAVRR